MSLKDGWLDNMESPEQKEIKERQSILEIRFSIDDELERVKKTIGKIDWYRENGYNPNCQKEYKIEGIIKY